MAPAPRGRGALWAAGLAAALGLLIALPWETAIDSEFVRDTTHDAAGPNAHLIDTPAYVRTTERIESKGEELEAWVYVPKGLSGPPPVVIMAHGMGAQKDVGLARFAERFAKHAIAVVAFDYRTFGGSDGEPRHWVSKTRHLEDYRSVIDHVQSTNLGGRVDGSRIALWGVSYSGGHVMVLASEMGDRIKAIVANEPYLAPPTPLEDAHFPDIKRSARLLAASLSDRLRHVLGLPPVYVRLAAPMREGALALVPLVDSDLGLFRPSAARTFQGGWKNKVLARLVVETLGYRPGARASAIAVPSLFVAGTRDHLAPPAKVRAAAARVRAESEVIEIDASHVEALPMGARLENFARIVGFLHRHLGVTAADVAAAAALAAAAEAEAGAAEARAGAGAAADAVAAAASAAGGDGVAAGEGEEVQFPSTA